MIRFDKLTVKAQEALEAAQQVAAQAEQQQIEPLPLLGALAGQGDGVVPPLLARLGVRTDVLAGEIRAQLARLPKVSGIAQQYLGPATNEVLKRAFDEAERFKDEYVSTEHLLLGVAGLGGDAAAERLPRHASPAEGECQ